MLDLYNYSLPMIFLLGLGAIFAAIEIGYWLGAQASIQGDDNVSTLEGAVIGLLALIVGFTFAMALARFEARRDAVLTEANAIGNPNRTERRCWDCYGIMLTFGSNLPSTRRRKSIW